MFLDCFALLIGLAATVVTKWPKDSNFTFGYQRAEILSGFVNGMALLFIAFFVFKEAVERLFVQPHIEHERLFIVSVMGFIVNIIGIYVFNHGRGVNSDCSHSHHHNHNHSHDMINHSENEFVSVDIQHLHEKIPTTNCKRRSHLQNQIIRGVFLHIVADTLGSVAVIISSYLVSHHQMHTADTISSLCCGFLIFISAIPLVKDSFYVLMERVPSKMEDSIKLAIQNVKRLPGVYQIMNYHVWVISTTNYCALITVAMATTVDKMIISNRIREIFNEE